MKKADLTEKKIFDALRDNKKCLLELSKQLNIDIEMIRDYLDRGNGKCFLKIFVDGGSRNNPGESGIGIVIENSDSKTGYYEYTGILTNNEAEYNALIRALEIALEAGADELCIYTDSELMCNQINGTYKVRSGNIKDVFLKASSLLKNFGNYRISHIPRTQNKEADRLVNMAIDQKNNGKIELTVAPPSND